MKTRIVVADDNPAYLQLLVTVFRQLPEIEVVGTATDGWEAVRVVVAEQADVALLDVEMPGLDGLAAASEIRRLHPQTELVVHTGGAVDELRRRGRKLNLGVFDKLELTRTLDHIVAYGEARL